MMRSSLLRLTGCAVVSLLLAACASQPVKTPSVTSQKAGQAQAGALYKIGQPYKVNGIWYYPAEDFTYDETGIASWYGPDFNEKYTANGEIFDQNEVSAAHKTLPMPTIVQVTNLENGRSIQVRINDRGPFIGNRIIDLSRRAAQLLGFEMQGTAKVRVRVLVPETIQGQSLAKLNGGDQAPISTATGAEPAPVAVPRESIVAQTLAPPKGVTAAPVKPSAPPLPATIYSPPKPQTLTPPQVAQAAPVPPGPALSPTVMVLPVHPTHIYVQVGAFSSSSNADRMKSRIAAIGTVTVSAVRINGVDLFRVRLGPIATADEADGVLSRAVAAGANDAKVIVD